jgi:signal transduction histidine kinase
VLRRLRSSAHGRSPLLFGIALILLALLGAFAYLLVDSQARVRQESQKRFQTRAVISAALTESLFSSVQSQGQLEASRAFGGAKVSRTALDARVKQSKQKYAVVLDSKGNRLAASSSVSGYGRGNGKNLPFHVRQALKGKAYLSGVISAPGRPDIIEWALPFKSRSGLRVIVSGGRARPFVRFLTAYLARARESASMEAYVVEQNRRVIASAGSTGKYPTQLDAALADAIRRAPRGTYGGNGDHYFASSTVAGSNWRVVLSEPTSDLYPILAEGRTWVLWTVFVAFALASAVSLVLLRRLFRSSDDLAEANLALQRQTKLAQEASRAKSDFLANMSHELRTPLTSMIGYTELMASDVTGTSVADYKRFLGVVVSNGRHLEGLIDGILDLSKVEARKMDFYPEPVDLADLVDDLTTDMRVLAEAKQIELVAEVAPDVRSVTTDPTRLKQVAFNYLSNAVKFTPEGGRIEFRFVWEGDDCFRLVVKDNGIGIAEEDQRKLFRHFQQVDLSAEKKHQGTGLGLSLVKRIVEAQGGKVGVHSESGKGSIFYAILPRNKKETHSAPVPSRDGETTSAEVPLLSSATSAPVMP